MRRFIPVAAVLLALSLPVAGCLGRVRVNPGAKIEKTHEGPDGKTRDTAFYGGQIIEWETDDPAEGNGLGSAIAYLGNKLILGLLMIAGVIGLGFALRWVFGKKGA